MKHLRYQGSPKHKAPWQPGRKGSLCPKEITLEQAQKLLEASDPDPRATSRKRYAIYQGRPFCAAVGEMDVYHGWPIGFSDVPAKLIQRWIDEGIITRSDVERHWMVS